MKFVCLDTETSGLFDYTKPADADGQPRLAEIALLFLAPDFSVERTHHALIKPDGWEMQPGAQAIHGLTQDRLLSEGQPVAASLSPYVTAVEEGWTVVGYNVNFDLKVMRGELRRAGLPDMFEKTLSVCCMRPLTDVCKVPKAKGNGYKFPKLVEAYQHLFSRGFDGAHGALEDATACADIFKELHIRGILPAEPAKEIP